MEDSSYWEIEPNEIVIRTCEHIKSGNALDLGCGEGRDAAFLTKKGFDVLAVDSSARGIHKAEQLAKIHKLKIKTRIEDIIDLSLNKNFDLILCNNVLHFLDFKNVKKVIEKMKKHTKIGGLNVISAFIENSGRYMTICPEFSNKTISIFSHAGHEIVYNEMNDKKGFAFLFKENQLKEFYREWDIIHYKELTTGIEQHDFTKLRRHGISEIIARIK
ncbi:methyltransferase domain-containing protein [Candidatus Pacearchaeota archaeon]|nr:methyltransferase domain-containing protein [Candidatus Pacearchaeota archaeon]